ncbi:VTC domain-containing protein [Candidatus Margulisiibacteriota bacterium]
MSILLENKDRIAYRYEHKYVIDGMDIHKITAILKHHPALFRENYKKRLINNIYLDSHDMQHYLDNINDSTERMKVRIRWYGESRKLLREPYLEIKRKKGSLGYKERFKLRPFRLGNKMSYDVLKTTFACSDIPASIKMMLKSLSPTLINRYERKYYLSADKKFRITLDYNLEYNKQHYGSNYLASFIKDLSTKIMELKYEQGNDNLSYNISSYLPFDICKNSKYINGIEGV